MIIEVLYLEILIQNAQFSSHHGIPVEFTISL